MIEQCDPPFVDLHVAIWVDDNKYLLRNDARRFETWEQNIAAKIGLGVAVQYALDLGLPAIWEPKRSSYPNFRPCGHNFSSLSSYNFFKTVR